MGYCYHRWGMQSLPLSLSLPLSASRLSKRYKVSYALIQLYKMRFDERVCSSKKLQSFPPSPSSPSLTPPPKPALLHHPFTMIVAGPTGSGKTVWVTKLLSHYQSITTFKTPNSPRPTKVLWCYGQWQQLYMKPVANANIQHYKGLTSSNINSLSNGPPPDVIVIDDLMAETVSDPKLASMFTRESHHENISVIFIVQNLYVQGRKIRDIALNTHYLVIMKTKRDLRQIMQMGNQIMYGESKYFKWAFQKATNNVPFSYLFCHLHPKSEDVLKLSTYMLPHEYIKGSPLFFIPNSWST